LDPPLEVGLNGLEFFGRKSRLVLRKMDFVLLRQAIKRKFDLSYVSAGKQPPTHFSNVALFSFKIT
jgi:hypothetical protein